MSTAINSTHQQDRAAQQKLVNARQQASAQGQQQGVAFSQMLSLACDEDTDLDALQLGGKLFSLKDDGKDGDAKAASSTKRKADRGLATGMGGNPTDVATDAAIDGLHPAAQANATLMALLAQAQSQTTAADAGTEPQTAALAAPADGTERPAGPGNAVETRGTDITTDVGLTKPAVPGQAVRDLARQLNAAARQALPGQDSSQQAVGNGVAWGRQPMLDATAASTATATAAAAAAAGGLEAGAGGALGALPPGSHTGLPNAVHGQAQARAVVADEDSATAADGGEVAPGRAAPAEIRTAGGDGQSQAGMGGDALGGTEMSDRGPNPEEAVGSAEQWREQWAEAMDQMGQQVSYWVTQGGVRQATLRVGNGWQQAMDVKLSMKNGQAEIEFLTDHEAARSAIAEGGTEVLRELLAQSGIDLGQVSVGAQTTGSGADDPQGQAGTTRVPSPANAMPATPAAPATALQPRHANSTGLDLYV